MTRRRFLVGTALSRIALGRRDPPSIAASARVPQAAAPRLFELRARLLATLADLEVITHERNAAEQSLFETFPADPEAEDYGNHAAYEAACACVSAMRQALGTQFQGHQTCVMQERALDGVSSIIEAISVARSTCLAETAVKAGIALLWEQDRSALITSICDDIIRLADGSAGCDPTDGPTAV